MKYLSFLFLISFTLMTVACKNGNSPAEVKIEKINGKNRITVNGKEFFVAGAGLEFADIDALKANGANSFRTWRTNNADNELAMAKKNGLMVLVGLEMKPERNGFDYSDTAAVRKQFEEIKAQVEKYKNHPNVLGWVIGNELNLFYKNPVVWNVVNDIAEYIHKNDPNHVTTTTLAGISKDVIDEIKKRAPALDFISIQMYGDIVNLQKRIKDAEWTGPYMVTEWGATGHWEVAHTAWGAPIEQSSTEKATAFFERYQKAILSDTVNCLGSFVFLWGQKQERTPTWYGMFSEQGEKTETVDAMYQIWKGIAPENRCPSIQEFTINGKTAFESITLKPGASLLAKISSKDAENDTLEYTYEILYETNDKKLGGDKEARPETVFIVKQAESEVTTSAPVEEGAYRLFFFVRDHHNHCATANIPFLVKK